MLDAVRASIALPGLLAPARWEGSLLVDGGLVNPVPVSLARAMGADVVVAVDLASDILGRRFRRESPKDLVASKAQKWMREHLGSIVPESDSGHGRGAMPSLVDVLATSLDIGMVRIARNRLAGDPPEVLIGPRLAHLHLFDFHRAKEAIEEGHRAVERVADNLGLIEDYGL
jgi:NTE family protein